MSMDRNALQQAAEKHKLPQIIVGYLKLQQAKKMDFFTLFLEKKINGRLFYNTCLPDGTKEIKFGNEDFLQEDFKNAVDYFLMPFKSLSLEQIKHESVQPSDITNNMREVIDTFMHTIESSKEWQQFWNHEIHAPADSDQKKQLYNMIAGAAAYKALVSCIDQSNKIADPIVKRNIAALISICTNKYESPTLQASHPNISHEAAGAFMVFKKQQHKTKDELQPQNVLMK